MTVITTNDPAEPEILEGVATDENAEGGAAEQETEGSELVVTIGDPATPDPAVEEEQKAPEWVRELRKKHREEVRKNKELEDKLKALTAEPKPAGLPEKPTLASCDYDEELFATTLDQWHDKKRQHDEHVKGLQDAEAKAAAEWQAKLDSYVKAKTDLRLKDFDEAEAEAKTIFSVTQQGIIVQGAENPALVVYALGKNPEQAQKLASITDAVKFTFAVAKLEAQLKVSKKSAPPPPEERIAAARGVSGAVDSTLDRLREEAAKTGDFTKVHQYKQQQRDAKTTR